MSKPIDLLNQSVKVEKGADYGARRSTLSIEPVTRVFEDVSTPYEGFLRTLRSSGDRPCFGTRGGPENKYQWITYKQVDERATNLGSGLVHLGCEPSQNTFIGIYAPNCTEWDLADLACQMYSMISVPIYDTHGAEGCVYIMNHADIETVICNGKKLRFLFDNAKKCEKMKRIIKIDEPVKEEEKKEADSLGLTLLYVLEVEQMGTNSPQPRKPGKPDEIMTICYTSGTTGTPKGAMITHGNLNATASALQLHYQAAGIDMTVEDCMISYLPLAHMYERLARVLCYLNGVRVGFFRGDVKLLLDDIQELKPTIFPSVPRLLTRVYDKVMAQLSQSKFKSWLFHKALSSKEADLRRGIIRGDTMWDRIVFKKIKLVLGGNVRIITTGAAPLSNKVMTFLRCVLGSCYVVEGYGQTENAAAATFTCINDTTTGHVGPPLSCNMIKLIDVPEKECYSKDGRGEICLKGPNIFLGYLKAPEKTAETIDKDGWLHTGDIGEWLPNGPLKIVDRVKHIFKLAQGEYLAPEKIENIYLRSRFVAQAFVHGDSLRSFIVGIIIPDQEVLEPWARSKKIPGDFAELCENEDVRKAIFEDMKEISKEGKLNSFEEVKAIYLHREPFSVENGYLTPTFKTKRAVVEKDFQQKFQELYGEVDKRMQYVRSTSFEIKQVV